MKSLFILLLLAIESILCDPLFVRGRPHNKYGMLGLPTDVFHLFSATPVPKEEWFEQRLNHFDPTDSRRWQQRYFINDQYYKPGGPVFLQLGGEGEASPTWLVYGQTAVNYAKQYHALNVMLEHRYYGKSQPTSDLSTENLKYLSSEQALRDAATFIQYLTKKMSLDKSKWLVFGGSYSGSLAAWLRLKYPHLVSGAIASSAPIEAVVNFKDYLGVVTNSLGQECSRAVKEAMDELTSELKNPSKWETLRKQLHLYYPLDGNNTRDVATLVLYLAGNFMTIVQYNNNRMYGLTIDAVCDMMTDTSMKPLDRLIKFTDMVLKAQNQKQIDHTFNGSIEFIKGTSWDSPASSGTRQWVYQTCIEFGFYQTSDLTSQPFGQYFDTDYFVDQCKQIFGDNLNHTFVNDSIDSTNNYYGGLKPQMRKVIFPNGSVDPWHALGVLKDLASDVRAVYINGTSHCADMLSDSDGDSQQLISARLNIKKAVGEFLKN